MRKILPVIFLIMLLSCFAAAQQYKLAPLPVKRSTLIEQIKALRQADPKIAADDLAKSANEMLGKNGINAVISFDSATCEKIKKVRDDRKDQNSPIHLGATLKSVTAEAAALALPEPQFASDDCGGCFIEVPVLQITPTDFITIVEGQNIKFVLPANFIVNSAELLDPKNPTAVKRKFLLPFRSKPIGITFDENALYMGFNEPELIDLALIAFDDGTLQIGTRKEAEDGGVGKVTDAPGKSGSKQIKFERWKTSYLVSYISPCK